MTFSRILLATLASSAIGAASAAARCYDDLGDADEVAAVREQVEDTCGCEGYERRGDYMRCVRDVVKAAVDAGDLQRQCKSAVMRCASRSTCGRKPGYVTCCRTNGNGRHSCAIKRGESRCRAPRNGSACVSGWASSCDACDNGACVPTPTPSPTPTPTVPSLCESLAPLPRLAQVPFTIGQGTTACGGEHLTPGPEAPFSGRLDDAEGNKVADLGLGCLYTGSLAGVRIPDGAASVLDVVGINGTMLTVAGSDGNGTVDCTKGAGPERTCANGSPGTDGEGACTSDSDCGGTETCLAKPNCTFGPPLPVPGGAAPVCIVNVFASDMCGSVDILSLDSTLTVELSSRIHIAQNGKQMPCPTCVDNVCVGGDNDGQACTTTSSTLTSKDCPPSKSLFIGSLPVVLPAITTATSTLGGTDPLVCPGQTSPGLLGVSAATSATQTGQAAGLSGEMSLVSTFCVDATASTLLNSVAGLPSGGALSVTGTMDFSQVLALP